MKTHYFEYCHYFSLETAIIFFSSGVGDRNQKIENDRIRKEDAPCLEMILQDCTQEGRFIDTGSSYWDRPGRTLLVHCCRGRGYH